LPKALIDQGAAVTLSFGLSTLMFMVTIPGKAFIVGDLRRLGADADQKNHEVDRIQAPMS
jgi:hypothetical protein